MSEPNSPKQRNARAVTALNAIRAFKARDYMHASAGAFWDAEPLEWVERIVDCYAQLLPQYVESLPTAKANRLREQLDRHRSSLTEWLGAPRATTEAEMAAARAPVVSDLTVMEEEAYEMCWPLLAYARGRVDILARDEAVAKQRVESLTNVLVEAQTALKARKEEFTEKIQAADKNLKLSQNVLAQSTVKKHSVDFSKAAKAHNVAAWIWLGAVALLALALAGSAIYAITKRGQGFLEVKGFDDAVQLGIAKVVYFSTLASFLVVAAKNYFAHQHNKVVNRHRQDALNTYVAMVNAAEDHVNRDIVLTKAAECIYAPQPTGFMRGESTTADHAPVVSLVAPLLKAQQQQGGNA